MRKRGLPLKKTNWLGVLIASLIIVVLIIGVAYFFYSFLKPFLKTIKIDYYLRDGEMVTYSLSGYGSKLKISVTSTNDYMYVKIIVNGQTIFEGDRLYELNKEFYLPSGYHYIDIIFKNPTIFGLGPAISINGYASLE